jgi:hypothetical protein
VTQYVDEKPDAPILLQVYAGANGKASLYEDDGVSNAYERGEFTRIPVSYDDKTGTVTIGARSGQYKGMVGHLAPVQGALMKILLRTSLVLATAWGATVFTAVAANAATAAARPSSDLTLRYTQPAPDTPAGWEARSPPDRQRPHRRHGVRPAGARAPAVQRHHAVDRRRQGDGRLPALRRRVRRPARP